MHFSAAEQCRALIEGNDWDKLASLCVINTHCRCVFCFAFYAITSYSCGLCLKTTLRLSIWRDENTVIARLRRYFLASLCLCLVCLCGKRHGRAVSCISGVRRMISIISVWRIFCSRLHSLQCLFNKCVWPANKRDGWHTCDVHCIMIKIKSTCNSVTCIRSADYIGVQSVIA